MWLCLWPSVGVTPGASAPLWTVAMLSTCDRSAYSPCKKHFPHAGQASVHPICEAIRQPIHADSVRADSGANAGRDGQAGAVRQCVSDGHNERTVCDGLSARVGGLVVGAKYDGYAGTIGHYEHTIHGGLDARVNVVGAVGSL